MLNTNVKGVYFSYTIENTSGADQTTLSSSCYGSHASTVPLNPPIPSVCMNRNDGNQTFFSLDGYAQPLKSLGVYFTEVSYTSGGLVPTATGVWENTTKTALTVRATLCTSYVNEGTRFVIQVDGVEIGPYFILPTVKDNSHSRQWLFEVPSGSVVRIMGCRSTSANTSTNIRFFNGSTNPIASFELTSFPSNMLTYP